MSLTILTSVYFPQLYVNAIPQDGGHMLTMYVHIKYCKIL